MDISTITDVKELKAMAFDQVVAQRVAEQNLQSLNQRITQLESAEQTEDLA